MTLMGDEPDLGLGDSGEHVTQLQDRLRGLRLLDKPPDGSYDDATEAAVRQLQTDLGQEPDGRMSAQTWQSLDQHMLSSGLEYNHYAPAGQQHWDTGEPAPSPFDPAQHPVSEDTNYYWDGGDWQAMTDADRQAHADHHAAEGTAGGDGAHAGAEAGAAAAPDVPHIDNIHPAIRDDPRFADFHDFLREYHGS